MPTAGRAEGVGRFLFVVPPLVGHVNPTVSVGRELAARGHRVAWTGHPEVVEPLLPAGANFLPVDVALPDVVLEAIANQPTRGLRGPAALKFLWQDFLVPLARTMLPGVQAAVDGFVPDVVVVDQQAIAGAAVCERLGVPWVTTATTSAELTDPLRTMPVVGAWVRALLAQFLREAGLPDSVAGELDPRFSPTLVLAFSTAALVGDVAGFPDHYAFVGPSIEDRPEETPFDWGWLDARRALVLVSLGTLNWAVGVRFFGVAAQALAALDVQGVIVAPPDLVPDAPPNVRVFPRIPQLALLRRAAAVACHGGHNTVCEALAEGVPLVVAPIRDDQPIIAQQVVDAGAGLRIKFGRVRPDGLSRALHQVLTEPTLRAGAVRVRDSFAEAGGHRAAADRLVRLLAPAPGTTAPRLVGGTA
jgi:MGT family glycosyltransferase